MRSVLRICRHQNSALKLSRLSESTSFYKLSPDTGVRISRLSPSTRALGHEDMTRGASAQPHPSCSRQRVAASCSHSGFAGMKQEYRRQTRESIQPSTVTRIAWSRIHAHPSAAASTSGIHAHCCEAASRKVVFGMRL